MKRQLQIRNGQVHCEWQGTGNFPIPPVPHTYDADTKRWVSDDGAVMFVDVTDRPDAVVGSTYDATSDTFTAPPPPPDFGATVDPREFMLLFTLSERKAIRNLAKTDEDVADFMALAQVPVPIRLKHPNTLAGLALLVQRGVISQARADAVKVRRQP